ncbi:MAG: hypothetical protein DRO07_02460, partial [Candidatus Iainarchaeum archaeon]
MKKLEESDSMLKLFKRRKEDSLRASILPDLIKPSLIENRISCIKVNNFLNRVIAAVGFPRFIREGWLDALISSEGDFDISLFIEPVSIEFV